MNKSKALAYEEKRKARETHDIAAARGANRKSRRAAEAILRQRGVSIGGGVASRKADAA